MAPHKFCPATDYCVRCGAGMDDLERGEREGCCESSNVVAVSHIVRGRALFNISHDQAGADIETIVTRLPPL